MHLLFMGDYEFDVVFSDKKRNVLFNEQAAQFLEEIMVEHNINHSHY